MCGIIGYIGEKEIVPILVDGLKKLQYRGYDSCGVSVINTEKKIDTVKAAVKIAEFEEIIENEDLSGEIGIAHTRWATHGEPSTKNAHPHVNEKQSISVVHNGIIENYPALKKLLENKGYEFISETDSEIFCHLIDHFYEGDIKDAVVSSLNLIEGTFGLAVIHKDHDQIVVAKRGSPLVIGVGKHEMFVTSDVASVIAHTKQVIYLEDDEIGVLSKDSYAITRLDGEPVDKEIDTIKWDIASIEKSGYNHFMLKEIFEQPSAIENCLRGRLKNDEVKLSIKLPHNIEKIVFVACGTSWHAGLIGKYVFESLCGIATEVDYASEFRYRNPIVNDRTLVIAISQSGETADTLAALSLAREKGAHTMGIVNTVGSSIARMVDSGIYLHAGPEIGVASTKAFSCQATVILLLACYLMREGNGKGKKLLDELFRVPQLVSAILRSAETIQKIATQYANAHNCLYLGRGVNFPVALEGALKLKEISYIHAEGYPAAEMKHGPIALVDENMPVVFVAPKDNTFEKILSNIEEIKSRKGKIIVITDTDDERLQVLSDHMIVIPKTHEFITPILMNIPLQLFAYYIADSKGLDVDKPRNLAKSVTVE